MIKGEEWRGLDNVFENGNVQWFFSCRREISWWIVEKFYSISQSFMSCNLISVATFGAWISCRDCRSYGRVIIVASYFFLFSSAVLLLKEQITSSSCMNFHFEFFMCFNFTEDFPFSGVIGLRMHLQSNIFICLYIGFKDQSEKQQERNRKRGRESGVMPENWRENRRSRMRKMKPHLSAPYYLHCNSISFKLFIFI